MKKTSLIAMVMGLLFAAPAFAKVNVFACEPEWAALAEQIGGKHVKTYSATHGMQDPHHVRARPSLMAKMRQADLLICSGAELEVGWLPILQQKAGGRHVQPDGLGYIEAARYVPLLDIPQALDRSMGHVHASGNPHVHLNPHNILLVADEMLKRLQRLDPKNKDVYADNAKQFKAAWTDAIRQWEKRAENLDGVSVVIQHKNWSYLFDWLGIEQAATLEPVPGVPPGAGYLSELLQNDKATKALYIVHASYQSDKAANWFGDKAQIKVVALPLTIGGHKQAKDLFSLFDTILKELGV